MRLRTAKKIYAAIGTDSEQRYTSQQKSKAIRVHGRCRATRETEAWWGRFMKTVPAEFRAKCAMDIGKYAQAFKILMGDA